MNIKTLFKSKAFKVVSSVVAVLGIVIVVLVIKLRSSNEPIQAPDNKSRHERQCNTTLNQKRSTPGGKPSKCKSNLPAEGLEEEEEEVLPTRGSASQPKNERNEKVVVSTPNPGVVKKEVSEVSKEPLVENGIPSQGTDSLDDDKTIQFPPIDSYFDFPAPRQATTKLLRIEDVKDFDAAKLQNLQIELSEESKSYAPLTGALYTCQANIYFISGLLADSTSWDAQIYNAWKGTGFKVVGCPEFITWAQHDLERNRDDPSRARTLSEMLKTMYFKKQKAIDRSDSGEHVIEWHMMNLVLKGARLAGPAQSCLFRFASTGTVDDAKAFITSIGAPPADPFNKFKNLLLNPPNVAMNSEPGFALKWLYLMYNYKRFAATVFKNISKSNNSLLKNNQSLDEEYKNWIDRVEKDGEGSCLEVLNQLTNMHLLDQRLEDFEQEHKYFQDTGRCEKVELDFTKGIFGVFVAFRAYVGLRKYLDNVNVADLENNARLEFGFASLPLDRSCLSIDTFMKNTTLHKQLSTYFRARVLEVEWKTWNDIFDSIRADVKRDSLVVMQRNALKQMMNILGECKPGGRCKIDVQSRKISCTLDTLNETLAQYNASCKTEEATFFQALLHEAMQCNDLEEFMDHLKDEETILNSNVEAGVCPPIAPYLGDVDYEFNLVAKSSLPFASALLK